MSKYIKGQVVLLFILAVFIFVYIDKNKEDNFSLQNEITFASKINITKIEKEQIEKSVDLFMNEYKLPKGVKNSYKISVESILNDSVKIIVNEFEIGDAGNVVIYARKINNTWEVDPKSGPWCTLETFSDRTCF